MTTPIQLRRIKKVREVMAAAVSDGTARKYNHNSYDTCTIGYIVDSGLFTDFKCGRRQAGLNVVALNSCSISEEVISFFGNDYWNYVANMYTPVMHAFIGIPQVNVVIRLIDELIARHEGADKVVKKKKPTANDDTIKAGRKITARVKSLTASIELADKLLREDAGASMVDINALKSARDELSILQQYV